jgi:chromosome segregation protein
VQLLCADAASGARSAAIIGQGRIGAIVDAKPADRRRLLEEAAGIGGLQARRHEAELKLQAAEANLLRVQDLLVTLGEQHRQLRKQAREAGRYRELSARHREVEAALLACRWRLAALELAAAEQLLQHGRTAIELRSERLSASRAAREHAAAELDRLRQRDAALATDLARLGERRRAVGDEAARLQAEQTRMRALDEQLERDLGDGRIALEDARSALARLAAERDGLVDQEVAATGRCAQAAAAEAATAQTLEAAEAELRRALAVEAELEARLRQLEARRARSVEGRRALVVAEQDTEQTLATLAGAAPIEQPGAAGEADAAAVDQADAALRAAEAAADHAAREREAARDELERAVAQLGQVLERLRAAEQVERQAAQQRDGLLARRDDVDRRGTRLRARALELQDGLGERMRRRTALDLAAREAALQAAERDCREAEALLDAARAHAAEAESVFAEARRSEQSARGALQRLEVEQDALAALAGPDPDGTCVIDLIDVAEGGAQALAAALGDDLLGSLETAAPSHWRAASAATHEAQDLPPGCRPLADLVDAPSPCSDRRGRRC